MNAIQNYDLFTLQCQIFGLRAFYPITKEKKRNKTNQLVQHIIKLSIQTLILDLFLLFV